MTSNIGVIIAEKSGSLKPLCVKNYDETQLYKRCGFKSDNNFQKHCEWRVTKDSTNYIISIYGKDVGRVGLENNYRFPPPINNILLFGNCVLVLSLVNNPNTQERVVASLSIDFWESIRSTMVAGNYENDNDYNEAPKENIVIETNSNTNEVMSDNSNEEYDTNYFDGDMSELVEEEYLPE